MSRRTIKKMNETLRQRGEKANEIAKEAIMEEKLGYEPISEALHYFMNRLWYDSPHPALLSLICESVGGKPEDTAAVGAALVLLTGAVDIHDDIIDKSKVKAGRKTVLGKYGKDISLLVGDALLMEGCMVLSEACRVLPEEKSKSVLDSVEKGFFELGAAEAKEASFRGNWDLSAEVYFDVMMMKASVSEATAHIGAVLGNAGTEIVESLGQYGRILGLLMNLRDEFVDVFEAKELQNRIDNECLPLPILCAFHDPMLKRDILLMLKKRISTSNDALKVAEAIERNEWVQELKIEMENLEKKGLKLLNKLEPTESSETLSKLLKMARKSL